MTDDGRIEVLASGGGTQLAPSAGDPFDEDDPGPWRISGLAMTPGVTTGGSMIPTYWSEDVLREAAPYLEGEHLLSDRKHDPEESPGVDEVLGEVTESEYIDGHGIGYTAEIDDRDVARKIARNRLDGSPHLVRTLSDETRDVDGQEATVADEILGFDGLAVVRTGAGSDVGIELGTDAVEALAEAFDVQPSDEPAESGTDTNMSDIQDSDGPDVEQLQKENRELRSKLRSLEGESDDMKMAYAEALSETSPFDAETLCDRFEFRELREQIDAEDVVETLTPAPRTRDLNPTGQTQGSETAETLSADEEQELEVLHARRDALERFADDDHLETIDERIETLESKD